jgi:hypothetical protein
MGSEYHDFVVDDLPGAVHRILQILATNYSRTEVGL